MNRCVSRSWIAAGCLAGLAGLCTLFGGQARGSTPLTANDEPPSARVVLTHKEYALASDPALQCHDRIHAHLTLDRPLVGEHTLEGTWIFPDGGVGARATVQLDYPRPGRRTAHLWLDFDGESGGMLSSSAGAGLIRSPRYGGRWLLEVRLDRKLILRTPFDLVCS